MIDYNLQAQVLEEFNITDNLKQKISVALDETKIFLDVVFMGGKFTIQKSFTNNYIGLEELEDAKKQFDSEEKVKEYFRL